MLSISKFAIPTHLSVKHDSVRLNSNPYVVEIVKAFFEQLACQLQLHSLELFPFYADANEFTIIHYDHSFPTLFQKRDYFLVIIYGNPLVVFLLLLPIL